MQPSVISNMITEIELTCANCQKSFKRRLADHKLHLKRGRGKVYCSPKCRFGHAQLDEFSDFKRILWMSARSAAKKKISCDLTLEFLKQLWEKQNGLCSYSGIPMTLDKKDKKTLFSASLDRIDSKIGYLQSNVEFVCLFINLGKNNRSKTEVQDFISRLKTISHR